MVGAIDRRIQRIELVEARGWVRLVLVGAFQVRLLLGEIWKWFRLDDSDSWFDRNRMVGTPPQHGGRFRHLTANADGNLMDTTMSGKRKICVVLVDRANYGRLKPVMQAIADQPELELQVLAAGTMVLERFDLPVRVVEKDGFPISGQIYVELEGSNPTTMAKSLGFGVVEFASEFRRLDPDVVLIIGDRYEALAATMAAAYMNLCIAHIQGGEVSGSIDESARHAISKFSHFHFPSTERAADYLVRMGEQPKTILAIGCPSSDIASQLEKNSCQELINQMGSGADHRHDRAVRPGDLSPHHDDLRRRTQTDGLITGGTNRVAMPTILLWPNIDAGSGHVNKSIRRFRERSHPDWLRTLINLMPEDYLRVLSNAQLCDRELKQFRP